jgi:hypothetical protein
MMSFFVQKLLPACILMIYAPEGISQVDKSIGMLVRKPALHIFWVFIFKLRNIKMVKKSIKQTTIF